MPTFRGMMSKSCRPPRVPGTPLKPGETPGITTRHRALRAVLSAVVIAAVIALGIAAGTFVLSPYGSKSQVFWSEFRQTEDIDTLCLGSSLIAYAYNPAVVDSICHSSSFNLSTPLQETAESYLALKEGIEHHKLKRVVFGVDYSAFIGEASLYPGRVFVNEKWKGDPFFERFGDLAYMLDDASWVFDEHSINWLFPWTEQQPQGGAGGIIRNVKMRLSGTPLAEAAEANEPAGWRYYGRGYGCVPLVLDYNTGVKQDFAEIALFAQKPFSEKKLAHLEDMMDLCAENGIEFIAVAPALPDFSLISLAPYYEDVSKRVRESVEAHGGAFYDFNVAAPSFYQARESDFEDYQHYNVEGGRAFSEAFAKLLLARAEGADTSTWFTSYDERIAGIDRISVVKIAAREIEGGAHLTASCLAGTNVKAEYQFLAKSAEEGEYHVIRDWSEDATFDFTPEEKSRYTVRVNARQTGSDAEFERYTEAVVRI